MTTHRSSRFRVTLAAVLAATVSAFGIATAFADDGTAPPGCDDLAACFAQTDTEADPTGEDASGDGSITDSGTTEPAPPVEQPDGTPVIVIVTTAQAPSTGNTPTETATTATVPSEAPPSAPTVDTTPAPAPPPAPKPHRGLYCHVVDGVWKMEDLVRDQEKNDPVWAAQGPWQEANYDPVTGIRSCDFPAPPADTATAATPAPPSTSTNSDKTPSQPKPPPTRPISKGAVRLPPLSVPTAMPVAEQQKPVVTPAPKHAKPASVKMVGLPALPTTTPTG